MQEEERAADPKPGKLSQLELEFSRNLNGRTETKKSWYTEEQISCMVSEYVTNFTRTGNRCPMRRDLRLAWRNVCREQPVS